jgi:hypothetical protein
MRVYKVSKIKIELECKGNAHDFFNAIMQDYFYSVKNSEDKALAAQYESLTYTITAVK